MKMILTHFLGLVLVFSKACSDYLSTPNPQRNEESRTLYTYSGSRIRSPNSREDAKRFPKYYDKNESHNKESKVQGTEYVTYEKFSDLVTYVEVLLNHVIQVENNFDEMKTKMTEVTRIVHKRDEELRDVQWNFIKLQDDKECITKTVYVLTICGLKEQLTEHVMLKSWKEVAHVIKSHLCNSTQSYKHMEDIEEENDLPITAASRGYSDIIQMLLCHGLPVNEHYYRNLTMLHEAARYGNYDTVFLLITEGADVNVQDEDGNTPLHWASGNGHENSAALLTENGADVNYPNSYENRPIHWAASNGQLNIVKLLANKGADINSRAWFNITPLIYAVKNGQFSVVKWLVDNGCNVHITDKNGTTALEYARKRGREDIVELLSGL